MKAVLIAGTTSGVGKTTIAVGLMGALRRRGLKVQPFKAGPDYIDPGYHTQVTGQQSRNLDTWLLSRDAVIELFTRAATGKDISVIEGVMGLFDGHSATDEDGSTAELAKLLGVPVILVLDSRKGARSLAAMVTGYKSFDPSLDLCGVILNGIAGERHLKLCQEAIEHYTRTPVLGYLPRREDLSLPERHLGLVPAVENPAAPDFFDRLVSQCEASIKIPEIIDLAEKTDLPAVKPTLFPSESKTPVVQIAVARDRAFSFYYQDSLDLLAAWGAEVVPFSPLEDASLPPGASGIYIGGGFPEMYAAELSANNSMKRQIADSVEKGMPVYAECGGLMYLGKSIRDFRGNEHKMVGSIPISSRIDSHRLSLGYRTVKALNHGPVLAKGQVVRGHEFHWSILDDGIAKGNAYAILDKDRILEGFQKGRTLASYIHLHFAGSPMIAQRFIGNCLQFQVKSAR